MNEPYGRRIEKLQAALAENGAQACLLVDRENLYYFGGIDQTECLAFVVPVRGAPIGLTLSQDVEYAKSVSAIADIRPYVFPRESLGSGIVAVLKEMGLGSQSKIAFERYFVSFAVFKELSAAFDSARFLDASPWIYRIRAIKDDQEIEAIRKASAAVCAGMAAASRALRAGVMELEVAAEAEYASMKAGSQGTPFRPQVVSGPRTITTHPFASEKKIEANELVLLHIGARYRGYTAKLCRSACVGEPKAGWVSLYEALVKTQERVVAALKPGAVCDDLVRLARESVEREGYGSEYLGVIGYGIGLRQSEFYPVIAMGNRTVLEERMLIDVLLPTIYHSEFGGPRITDTILIGASGAEVLTGYPTSFVLK